MPRLAALLTCLLPGLLLCLLAPLLATGCSSSAAKKSNGAERRVALHDYRNGQRFELLDEGQHSRLDQYSQVRSNANTKIQTGEVMQALAEFLRANGFDEFAQNGPLPAESVAGVAWALELTEGSQTRHVIGYPSGLDAAGLQRVRNLRIAFLETYNDTYSLQAVEVKPGETPFKAPDYERPSRR
jgi:hypothetical protein